MKKLITFLVPVALLFTACGGDEAKKEEAKTEEISGEDLLKDDGPVYDKTKVDPNAPVVTITLKAVGASMADMKYDQATLEVAAGSTVKLTLISESKDASMPHNWVLIKKGNMERVAAKGIEAGADKNFVPVSDDVFVATKMLNPGEKEELTFPAPPAGEYQFVCTYPGHSQKMNGVFIVK